MAVSARKAAAQALLKVTEDGGYSNLVLDSLLDSSELDSRDAAFATALFYGVLERRITLDHCISKHIKTPLRKLDKEVRTALRLSIYQLLYMDAVPDSAAVDEGVRLVKSLGKTSASGFVNGVLRSFLRGGKTIDTSGMDPDEALSVQVSCPLWLVRELARQYGESDRDAILQASLGRPPLYLRCNTTKISADQLIARLADEEVKATVDERLPGCLLVEQAGDIQQLESYWSGLFHVQDKASQLCAAAVAPEPGQRLLDVCAAPGGKSFTLAQWMEDSGELVSCDMTETRVGLIQKGTRRLGLGCIRTEVADATQLREELGQFDRVLCDVPCSGLGIIRRKPEIKYKDPVEFAGLPEKQFQILSTSAGYVKPGGTLVYSTCTLRREENEAVVERFLGEHPEFEPQALPSLFGTNVHHITLMPHTFGSDGFFIATLKKR